MTAGQFAFRFYSAQPTQTHPCSISNKSVYKKLPNSTQAYLQPLQYLISNIRGCCFCQGGVHDVSSIGDGGGRVSRLLFAG
jgi:hypothetical protein